MIAAIYNANGNPMVEVTKVRPVGRARNTFVNVMLLLTTGVLLVPAWLMGLPQVQPTKYVPWPGRWRGYPSCLAGPQIFEKQRSGFLAISMP